MMKIVADLHLHSHYSRATSKDLDFEHLSQWAQLKGVQVVGTGDIAHPGWLQEMKAKLEPAEEGLFRLKPEVAQAVQEKVPVACQAPVRFMLAGEISSIYKKGDKTRKVHNVIFAPSLAAVEKIQAELEKIGNIRSDGRPILGLPSRDLLEIILNVDPACYLIPAHIWTPWFSLLGSKSGYDSVEECFEDLTPHIFALETGLSSDPPMNWRVSGLDRYTLVSNSDAHSPQKLAREATLFNTELSYPALFEALKSGAAETFLGTLEFFPEEGKYHHDGHRKCNINWDPQVTIEHNGLCSVCGKPVTVGVLHRVEALADRPPGAEPSDRPPFHSLIPLPEVLGEVYGVGPASKRVKQAFEQLLSKLGSELSILLDLPLDEIAQVGGARLAEGLRRMRSGQVRPIAGYDGEPGIIKLFNPQDEPAETGQLSFLAEPADNPPVNGPVKERAAQSRLGLFYGVEGAESNETSSLHNEFHTPNLEDRTETLTPAVDQPVPPSGLLAGLNPQQRQAAQTMAGPLVIVAGPGTGKTRTLTTRLAYLIAEHGVSPEAMLAITFTNKAAEEMAQRLTGLLGEAVVRRMTIKTFHAFGLMLLREAAEPLGLNPNFGLAGEAERLALLKQARPDLKEKEVATYLEQISAAKNQLLDPAGSGAEFAAIYHAYEAALQQHHLLDLDDLIRRCVALFEQAPERLQQVQARFRWISVDEYQDVNQAQYRLLRLLAGGGANLCVIGDPDQAIYGFRGASREYFLRFQADYPAAKTLSLNRNYRSTQTILEASSQVITKSAESLGLALSSDIVDPAKLEIYAAPTDRAEAEYAVHEIEKMMGGTSYFSLDSARVSDDPLAALSFADFAVLYRLNAQSRPFIEAFERSGIPYQTLGQTPLVAYKAVRLILACLWLLLNPALTFPLAELVSKKQLKTVIAFLQTLAASGLGPVPALIEQMARFLVEQTILTPADQASERLAQLQRRATPFDHRLGEFLEAMALQRETDFYDPRADRVTLMTLHAAKGLEFPVVFIAGCEEGLLPYQRGGDASNNDVPVDAPVGAPVGGAPDIEEERRLFYVGMTRAQQRLILTHAKSRYLFGQQMSNQPSRFLDDIEQALKEIRISAYRKSTKETPDHIQLKLF